MTECVKLCLLTSAARVPQRGSPRSAGYDVYASEAVTIPATSLGEDGAVRVGRGLVATGLAVAIPDGLYGRVAPRSGLAVRHGIDVGAGVIDADYRDEVRILLFNFSADPFHIQPGDRVAQIVFERVAEPEIVTVDALDATERAGGFGSTGTR